mgnify:FL=1
MKNIFFILFVVWTLLGAALIYGVSVSESNDSILSLAANVISISPLFGLMLALGSLKASNQFNNWLNEDKNSLYYLAGGITFLFALPGLITGTFNPYYTVIFSLIVFMVFGVLKQAKDESFRLNWSDIAVWIVLWILFDLRWYMEILPAVDSISYTWWSIAVSVIAIDRKSVV